MANEVQMNEELEPVSNAMNVDKSVVEELAEAKKEIANQYYSLKQYKKALTGYNEVIEMCSDEPRYYGNRAACYMMLGLYRNALVDAKKCIELDPLFLKAYIRVIKCSLILGDIIEAETNISKLLKLDPDNTSVASEQKDLEYIQKYLKDADTAYAVKDFRKVVYCMDRCCDVSTSCTRFKLIKAECLAFLGRYEEAQEIANDVLHIDKQNADAIYIRGMCLYFQDNVDRAFAHFQQVLRLAPDHDKALEIYKRAKALKKKKEDGNAAFKMKRYQEAYNLFTEALTIDPQNIMTNAKLHFNKATAAIKLGRVKESITECTEALKLDENYLKALLRRGSSYLELNEYEDAVRDFEKACKIDNSRENKRFLMGAKMALKKSKRKDYYKILGIDKNASTDDIKKAYRKRAMVHHPDRHANATEGEKKEQEKKFKEVGEAYGILSDPKKRLRYDSGHDIDDSDNNMQDMDTRGMFPTFFPPDAGFQFRTEFYNGYSFHLG
ncbi:PREDICTED: dnaJ homolog subfamily C member 7 [Polistes canadensis]|uniref:dnaJ homolog subfamily C member 7 n=1 Tax=Polistes canadensis TaxID=91411 RepID=UPI000718BD06|nr:PREDICTED: dnaJ homolog subfamily C member 7 [Polistes canadensis]KAI4490062.1 hypothetical protein M0804_004244 [Polistes exclamans]